MSDNSNVEFYNAIPKRYENVLTGKIKPSYRVVKSAKSIFYQSLKSTAGAGNFATTYLIQPTKEQFIGDIMYEEVVYMCTLNITIAPGATVRPFSANNLAVCLLPNMAITNTLTTQLGNQSITINSGQIMNALFAFNKNPEMLGRDFVDSSQLEAFADLPTTAFAQTANKGQFGNYTSASYGVENRFDIDWQTFTTTYTDGRANIQVYGFDNRALTNTTGAAITLPVQLSFASRSPVWNGLNGLSLKDEGTFTGITNYQLNKTVVPNPQRIIQWVSPAAGLTLASVSVSCVGIPNLYYKIVNMPDNMSVPRTTYYLGKDYTALQMQAVGTVAANSVVQGWSSQPLNLTNVPRAIYLWFGDNLNTLSSGANDTGNPMAPGVQIQQLTIQYGGQNIVQNLQTPFQIYNELCASEGFVKTFSETGYVINSSNAADNNVKVGLFGTVCRIDVSKLGIDWSKLSNGMQSTLPFQIQATFQNLANRARPNLQLFIQPVYDKLFVIDDGNVSSTYALLTTDQLEQVRRSASTEIVPNNELIGGNIFSKIGDAFKTVYNKALKPAGEWAWDHKNQIANVASKVAPMVGLGKHKKTHRGGSMYDDEDNEYEGGAIYEKSEMKRKLKFL